MRGKFILSYLDYFIYLLTVFSALFIIAFVQMNQEAQKGNVVEKAEFIIEMEWSKGSTSDVDLWVGGPGNTVVYFAHADGKIITLDRDDLGINNTIDNVTNEIRKEVVSIRSLLPGEYTVNVMMYRNRTGNPEHPKVTIRKLNPYKEILEKSVEVIADGQEETVINFTVDTDGNVSSMDDTPTSLVLRK